METMETMETKLNRVLASTVGRIWDHEARKLAGEEVPTIGVSWEGIEELRIADRDSKLKFQYGGQSYKVLAVDGLKGTTVALMF